MRVMLAIFLILASTDARGQDTDAWGVDWSIPDSHGEYAVKVPEIDGVTIQVPITAEYHIRNEGGLPTAQDPEGAGLCVVAANLIDGAYLGVADMPLLKGSRGWVEAKKRPGGYWPDKWEDFLTEVYPDCQWYSWEAPTSEQIEAFTASGIPVASTMNTGRLYQYETIGHDISTVHLDRSHGVIVDNNHPGYFHIMPRREYDRRFPSRDPNTGKLLGWAQAWIIAQERADEVMLCVTLLLLSCYLYCLP